MTTTARPSLQDILPSIAEREHTEPETFPAASIAALYGAGTIAAPFPAALGGSGASLAEMVAALEAIARVAVHGLVASMPMGLAGVYGLGPGAAPEQHRSAWARQIERVAADYRQQRIYAACNSEKGAGGSLAATQTVATKGSDGRFTIAGEKILASSGHYASTFFSSAKVTQDDLPGAGIVEFFFVDVDAPGVNVLDDWDGFGEAHREPHGPLRRRPDPRNHGLPGLHQRRPAPPVLVLPVRRHPPGVCESHPPGHRYSQFTIAGPACAALRRRDALRAMHAPSRQPRLPRRRRTRLRARVLRTKTYVSQKQRSSRRALRAGRWPQLPAHEPVARALADSFGGTALRPPWPCRWTNSSRTSPR
jgi:hypothetical protein